MWYGLVLLTALDDKGCGTGWDACCCWWCCYCWLLSSSVWWWQAGQEVCCLDDGVKIPGDEDDDDEGKGKWHWKGRHGRGVLWPNRRLTFDLRRNHSPACNHVVLWTSTERQGEWHSHVNTPPDHRTWAVPDEAKQWSCYSEPGSGCGRMSGTTVGKVPSKPTVEVGEGPSPKPSGKMVKNWAHTTNLVRPGGRHWCFLRWPV